MSTYYNELDPNAAAWLRELIKQNYLSAGEVDERDIRNVRAADIRRFKQCHFFAGIGGWPLALALAGWPDWRPVWTGSPPCQPFSAAGKRAGARDERHLWPAFHALIRDARPPIVFGEQVASSDGRAWLTAVRADLDEMGYAVGAADLCAAGVGAPHIRQRLFWVALADSERRREARTTQSRGRIGGSGSSGNADWSRFEYIHCMDGKIRPIPPEPELFPLADGIPERVGRLRGYGNAIAPQVAAKFIETVMKYRHL